MNDVLDFEEKIVMASKQKRLLNFLIDGVLMLIICFGSLALLFGLMDYYGLVLVEGSAGENLLGIFLIIFMIAYYALQEYFFNGKTIGKFFTKTRVVTLENENIDFITSLKRNTIRVIGVGIDPFTFLGKKTWGWHDQYSYTKVIVDKI